MNKVSTCIVVILLIVYFVFTSGLVFEVTKSTASDRIDIPYSIGLSAERTGVSNIVTKDDMNCLMWLKDNWNGSSDIVVDYNNYCSVVAYVPVYFYLFNDIRSGTLDKLPDKGCYIYVSSWNTEHNQYIEAIGVGLRKAYPLPEFTYPLLYQSGNAKVLWKPEPSKG